MKVDLNERVLFIAVFGKLEIERPYGRSRRIYKGADKSLARPGRKQADVSERMA